MLTENDVEIRIGIYRRNTPFPIHDFSDIGHLKLMKLDNLFSTNNKEVREQIIRHCFRQKEEIEVAYFYYAKKEK